jgi:hypothetical protein
MVFLYCYSIAKKYTAVLYCAQRLFWTQFVIDLYVGEEVAYFIVVDGHLPTWIVSVTFIYHYFTLQNCIIVLRIVVIVFVDDLEWKGFVEYGGYCDMMVPL